MDDAKKRILHVDDEPDILATVKTILEKEGYEVKSVDSGIKALKELESGDFDLMLLDIMMPDMSGWDLFTRIKEMKENPNVVILSIVEVSDERLKEIKNYGIRDYITKPFHRDEFVERIKKAVTNNA
jgi:two-component system response regulator ResD